MEQVSETHTADVQVQNKLGLHVRASAKWVEKANGYDCDIVVQYGDSSANGKSIMQMMVLAATRGSTLTITTTGSDAKACLDALCELVNSQFGEE